MMNEAAAVKNPMRPAPAPAGKAKPNSKYAFETYLENHHENIKKEQDKVRKLCEMAVTLHRRFRGLTLSDLCGRYGARLSTNGKWLDWLPEVDGDIHPINIVQPAIRANTNACLQSNPAIEVKSANQEARHKQIAMRWQRVADFFQRSDWTSEDRRALLFDGLQKEGVWWVKAECVEEDQASVPGPMEQKVGVASYRCRTCGQEGITQTEDAEQGMSEIACPQCGNPADAMIKSTAQIDAVEQKIPVYEIKNRLYSFFNFVVDRYNAKFGGLQTAKWVMTFSPVDRAELEERYPQHDFQAPGSWSYQAQCDYALANADWRFLSYGATQTALNDEFEKFQCDEVYLHEEAYANYRAPADYKFVNGAGVETFSIKAGQSIAEAYQAKYGFNPKGLKFIWEGDRLLDIVSPEDEEVNFREVFSDVHWLRDSGSYLSSPYYSIVITQDDITQLNTMNHNIIARNAVIPTYYDSTVFDDADFSKEYIGSKNAHLLPDRDMSKAVMQLPIPTPSPHLSAQLAFLWETKDSISMVQPALRGEQQKGETWGAQRQQLEQSFGMLTSVLKSYAGMLCVNFKQKARLAAKHWTLEQFQRIGSEFGEIWADEDVQEMCEIDLTKDLVVSYRNGSEMPQTNLDREMKFFNGLAQLMPFVQAGMVDPAKLQKILQKIDEYSEFDFDLTGLEVNELIAQKRVIELATICEQFGEVSFEQIEAARQQIVGYAPEQQQMPDGQVAIVQTPITQLDVITEKIFFQSKIRFSPFEDLPQQRQFFVEQYRVEVGKTTPAYLYLELLETMIGMLDQAIQQQQAEAMMNDPSVQLAMKEKADENAKEQANAEREDQNRKEERESADAERQEQFIQGLITQGVQNEHDLEKTAMQGQIQKENNPKGK